jgi:RNA polymerase sigma-70 factor, ECF subfamily
LEIYEPCRERLWKFILSFINNRFDAKDIMSETTLIAYESFDKINHDTAFLSYLFTTARRLIYRRTLFNKRIDGSSKFEADDIANSDFGADNLQQLNELYAALDKIPKKQKEAIVLTAINGFSYSEAAEIMSTNIENIKKIVFRGREKLKILLDK